MGSGNTLISNNEHLDIDNTGKYYGRINSSGTTGTITILGYSTSGEITTFTFGENVSVHG